MREWLGAPDEPTEPTPGYGFPAWADAEGSLYPPDDPTLPIRPVQPPAVPRLPARDMVSRAPTQEHGPDAEMWPAAQPSERTMVPAAAGGGRMSLGCGLLATALILGSVILAILTHAGGSSGKNNLHYPGVQAGPQFTPTSTSTPLPSPTNTARPTVRPTSPPQPTATPDPTATPSPSPTATPGPGGGPSPTATGAPGGTPTVGATPTSTPNATATPENSPTVGVI